MAPKTIVEGYNLESKLEPILFKVMNEYQAFTPTTAVYPKETELLYLSLGLMGEMMEWFESGYDLKEAGDVFWYCSQICNYMGEPLYDIFNSAEYVKDYHCKINLAENLKKHLRDGKDISEAVMSYMVWALSQLRNRYYYSVNNPSLAETTITILKMNMEKLSDRKDRNVLNGDGDSR